MHQQNLPLEAPKRFERSEESSECVDETAHQKWLQCLEGLEEEVIFRGQEFRSMRHRRNAKEIEAAIANLDSNSGHCSPDAFEEGLALMGKISDG